MAAYFGGMPDLAILELDPARLTPPMRYEAPSTMAGRSGHSDASAAMHAPASVLFPHLNGPLNSDAIQAAVAAAGLQGLEKARQPHQIRVQVVTRHIAAYTVASTGNNCGQTHIATKQASVSVASVRPPRK